MTPYEFYGPKLCIRGNWLWEDTTILTKSNYAALVDRGSLNVLRNGRGRGNYSLVEFESIRPDIKEKIVKTLPPPRDMKHNILIDLIAPENDAIFFFAEIYRKADGRSLEPQKQQVLVTNAMLLRACQSFVRMHGNRKSKKWIRQQLSQAIKDLDGYTHSLPTSDRRLQDAWESLGKEDYASLIHGNAGNDHALLRTQELEDLIISLHTMKNKPFKSFTYDNYTLFLNGKIDVVNTTTGELYDPKEYQPVSEGTISNILNGPKYKAIVERHRSGWLEFNNTYRPHGHRHIPVNSFSKVSLDDRDLPRKLLNGKRVKAYYAYDVTSGAVIGASYSKLKDKELFVDCIKDMLNFIRLHDLGIPLEMEVEHHLVKLFEHDLMKAGNVFPFVRWCAAGNSQEKRAEHFNKAKKYGFEKRYQDGIGRWWAKNPAYRITHEKIFDDENDNYKEKLYPYEVLVAEDREIIERYNNGLHPNQTLHKGLTRMQVLIKQMSKECAKYTAVTWAKYIGEHTTTTIKRSQYMRVQYANYQLPSIDIIDLLQTNNNEVDAYYLREVTGEIPSIFIYQNNEFLCECKKLETYNEATAEQTPKDKQILQDQSKYIASFDKRIKDGRQHISKIAIIEKEHPNISQRQEDIIYTSPDREEIDEFEELLRNHNEDYIKDLARTSI